MLGADSALFGIKGWHHWTYVTVISFVLKLLEPFYNLSSI